MKDIFVFGDVRFVLKSIFCRISPVLSHIHQKDSIINTIDFDQINGPKQKDLHKMPKFYITSDTISVLHQISSGQFIEINEEKHWVPI